jgi:hypothetical protein
MAGAPHVFARARTSRYGSAEDVERSTRALARDAGVESRITVVFEKTPDVVARADVLTNSGHVRPIDAATLAHAKSSAVVPLMYEAWELRDGDIDLAACARAGIPIAGTNESHPAVRLFPFVGLMVIRLLVDGGIGIHGNRVVLWCDNPFGAAIENALEGAGATVRTVQRLDGLEDSAAFRDADAFLVAMRPRAQPVLGEREAEVIAELCPGAAVFQFWGDLDREALVRCGVPFWPITAPTAGHQGILPSALGPEPVIRLQSGGLKVGEVMARMRMSRRAEAAEAVAAAVASGFGQALSERSLSAGR